MLEHSFIKVHSCSDIRLEGRRGRELTAAENKEILQGNEDKSKMINLPFTKAELNDALVMLSVIHCLFYLGFCYVPCIVYLF